MMDVFSWRTAWILATGLTVLRMGEAFRHVVPPWESWIWFLVGISPAPFILGGFFLYRRHTMRALEMKVRALRRQVAQGKRGFNDFTRGTMQCSDVTQAVGSGCEVKR